MEAPEFTRDLQDRECRESRPIRFDCAVKGIPEPEVTWCVLLYLKKKKNHIRNCFSHWFMFQPVLHDWCNKGRIMCYPVCGMVHIKEPLLLIGKSSPCGGSRFSFSLSEWSLTICLTPYNRK